MKFTLFISILWCITGVAHLTVTEKKTVAINKFIVPFLDTLDQFANGEKVDSLPKEEFEENVGRIQRILSHNEQHWQPLLDVTKNLTELQIDRKRFSKQSYVKERYTTKEGTVVFSMVRFPDILIKMDNRVKPIDPRFNDVMVRARIWDDDRSYFDASEKAQAVQSGHDFTSLYLPKEKSEQTNFEQVGIVFSERVPLFSLQEIDQRILLHMMIKAAEQNVAIKNKLKTMYKEAIQYICLLNFGDINYGNLPFTKDGRLAPFDTDSQTADTGVLFFLRLFFGYKILDEEEVMNVVNENCSEQDRPQAQELTKIYQDHEMEDNFFKNNEKFIQEAVSFLADKEANFRDQFSMATIIHDHPNNKYVKLIDQVFKKKMKVPKEQATLMGRHCGHFSDITFAAAELINAKYPRIGVAQALAIVREILARVKDFGNLYSAEPIEPSLSNKRDLRSFICF